MPLSPNISKCALLYVFAEFSPRRGFTHQVRRPFPAVRQLRGFFDPSSVSRRSFGEKAHRNCFDFIDEKDSRLLLRDFLMVSIAQWGPIVNEKP